MDIEAVLRQLAAALPQANATQRRDAALRSARHILVEQCRLALGIGTIGASITSMIRLAAESENSAARRDCAVLMVHALGLPGLIPATAGADVCVLIEGALHTVLLRCGYPFSETVPEKLAVLQRLHRTIGELMQPYEPTFPNWQGLYAG
jgi:hypothetical protein